jgi:Tol biopolymer transport system component
VNPFWSPDGRYLSLSHEDPENADIYITSAERPLLLPLTDDPAGDFGASWAPTKPAQLPRARLSPISATFLS